MQAVQVTSQDMRAAISREGRSMVPILQSIFQVCPAAFRAACQCSAECYMVMHSVSSLKHIVQVCLLRSALRSAARQVCLVRSAATPK